MPTGEQRKRRREAVRRRRRLMVCLLGAVLLIVAVAAVVLTVQLVKNRRQDPVLPPDEPVSGSVSTTQPDDAATGEPSDASTEATTADTTAAPTDTPTDAPTAAPTNAPTAAPTNPPTSYTVNTTGRYVQTGTSEWYLRLVNPWNPLPDDYDYEENLATYRGSQQFDSRAMESLRQMIAAGSAYNLSAASLYRSYDLQVRLYERQVQYAKSQGYTGQAAEDKAATVVTRPGTSEHHTGLAVDVLGSGYSSLEQSFDQTPAFAWLKEHCAEYGFILRYPKEKEDVTGIIYEPWHYRYVGVEAATEIMQRGLTLEEYLQEKGL